MNEEPVDVREIDSTATQTRWSNGTVATSFLIEDTRTGYESNTDATLTIVETGDEWLAYIEEDD